MSLFKYIIVILLVMLLGATITDIFSNPKTIYNQTCLIEGTKAEIVSQNRYDSQKTKRDDTNEEKIRSYYEFEHNNCIESKSGNPSTFFIYFFISILFVISIGIYTYMWFDDRDKRHEEGMKALGSQE